MLVLYIIEVIYIFNTLYQIIISCHSSFIQDSKYSLDYTYTYFPQ